MHGCDCWLADLKRHRDAHVRYMQLAHPSGKKGRKAPGRPLDERARRRFLQLATIHRAQYNFFLRASMRCPKCNWFVFRKPHPTV